MPASPQSRSENHLRVMCWNIHKGVGGLDRRYDLDRTIAVIKHYSPDIVLLQEVAQGIRSLRNHDQATMLTNALELHGLFHPEHQRRVGGYGNLVLSRWPIFSPLHLDLTIGRRKRRGLLQAHIRMHVGGHLRSVVVHNAHLGLVGAERNRQLERFVTWPNVLRLHHGTPTIFGGDLNDLWGNLGSKHLIPEGFVRAGHLTNTFPSALPLRPLDGLFFRGGLAVRHFAVAKSAEAKQASDHLPIYADFVLLEP